MLKIGVQNKESYPEVRNIIDRIPNASYVEIKDWYFEVRNIKRKLRNYNKLKRFFGVKLYPTIKELYSCKTIQKKDVDFIHLFNSISYGNENWGVTYETIVPFHNQKLITSFLRGQKEGLFFQEVLKEIKILAKKNCIFIIAISHCAYKIQKEWLNFFPEYKEVILKKMHVLHPPQRKLMEDYKKTSVEVSVNFMLVGSELFCKGGIEVLNVFSKLKDEFRNFTLTIIGDVDRTNGRCYLSDKEKKRLIQIIDENKDRIIYHKRSSNENVLRLMKTTAHVGLLPTHSDTYGYSVLEFQASGCPVISTDLRALKEINNNELGWLINVPKSLLGEAFSIAEDELIEIQRIIEVQLEAIIKNILLDTKIIKTKGEKCLDRIERYHNPLDFSRRIRKLYEISD